MIAGTALTLLGGAQLVAEERFTTIPSWPLVVIGFILLFFAPIIAYHKIRVRLDATANTRSRELARLIFLVRDAANSAVMYSKQPGFEEAADGKVAVNPPSLWIGGRRSPSHHRPAGSTTSQGARL